MVQGEKATRDLLLMLSSSIIVGPATPAEHMQRPAWNKGGLRNPCLPGMLTCGARTPADAIPQPLGSAANQCRWLKQVLCSVASVFLHGRSVLKLISY